MRALTVQQPHAYLIACGRKTAELRSKQLTANETITIHAGKSIDIAACKQFNINPNRLETGVLLCIVDVNDCVDITSHNERLIEKVSCSSRGIRRRGFRKAHMLSNARRCQQKAARGNLGMWEVKPQTNSKAAGLI